MAGVLPREGRAMMPGTDVSKVRSGGVMVQAVGRSVTGVPSLPLQDQGAWVSGQASLRPSSESSQASHHEEFARTCLD